MIDWDFESRLIDRIAVREAAARLAPRERRIVARYFGHGETGKEIGDREGICGARVHQIVDRSLRKLRDRFRERPEAKAKPQQTTRATPPPGFDRAAFLRHMQGLIERREARARELFARERSILDALMRAEEAYGLFDPPAPPTLAPPPPTFRPPNHPGYTVAWPGEHRQQNVEPWFDLSKPLTLPHLRCIAQYTLGYLVAARRLPPTGTAHIGEMTTRAECLRDADAIATAMMQIAIPKSARYSACLLDVPDGIIAVALGSPHVALRLASADEGKRVSIEVTWDHGH